jgi:toxin ParE1/3/4
MARQIAWTEAAVADLQEIVNYFERESPEGLFGFIRSVKHSIETLDTFPEAGTLVRRYARKNVREKLAGAYRLVYLFDSDRLFVLGLIHSARDFWRAWRSKPRRLPK